MNAKDTPLEELVNLSEIANARTLRHRHINDVLARIKSLFGYRCEKRAIVDAYIRDDGGYKIRTKDLQIDNICREHDGRYRVVFDKEGSTDELFHFYLCPRGNTKISFLEDLQGSGTYAGLYVHTLSGRKMEEIFVVRN